MNILGQLEAQRLKQLNVEGQAGQPFVAPDDVGGAHEVVVHGVGEVVGGNAIGFKEHVIDVVLRDGQLALYQIVEFELAVNAALGTEPQHPGISGGQLCLNILHGTVTPDGVFAVVAGGLLVRFLFFPKGGQLVLRAEAGVGFALGHQLFGINVVNCGSLTLTVGAISAVVAVHGGAFVKVDVVEFQGVDEHLHRTGNLPLGIGVLYPEVQHAAGLVGHPFRNRTLHQIAQMDKSGRGGSHSGNHRTLGKVALGEPGFQLLGSFGHIGKKQFGKRLIIQSQLPLFLGKL